MFWNKKKKTAHTTSRAPLALSLEPRMMFDGAVAATVADAAVPDADAAQAQSADTHEALASPAAGNEQRQEIVFVDGSVQNLQELVGGLGDATELVIIDPGSNGFAQIADYLEGRSGIDAIHILSHGDTGKIRLGDGWLDSSSLAANQAPLSAIGAALSESGDILLYGCNVGNEGAGIEFIQSLAQITGADIAASDDATGATSRGGDWDLEVRHGVIESAALVLDDFSGLLTAFSDDMSNTGGYGTSFVRTVGGVPFIYTFTAEGDGGDLAYESQFGSGNSASMSLMSSTANSATTERMTITRTDLADFTFTSIYLDNTNIEPVIVAGYRDGVMVGTAQSMGTGVAVLNFGGIRVDEVRITSRDFFGLAIDDFTGDTDPPAPNQPPTLSPTYNQVGYTEGLAPPLLQPGLTISDDGGTFQGATVTISDFRPGDRLTVSNASGLHVNFNDSTGVLTITGPGSTAALQTALRAISYSSISDDPTFGGTDGTRQITFVVTDIDGASSTAAVTQVVVTSINDAPIITSPGTIGVTEDVSSALTGISFSDVDAGSQPVTVTLEIPSGSLDALSAGGVTVGGTDMVMTLTGSIANLNAFIAAGSVTYTTARNVTTTALMKITIDDGGHSGSGGALTHSNLVLLTVTPVNDAPVHSLPPAQEVDQNGSLTFSDALGNAITVSDVDAGTHPLTVTLTASNGSFSLYSLIGVDLLDGASIDSKSITFSGTLSSINMALNGLTFKPSTGFAGAASLQITTNDNGNTGSGGAQSVTDTIDITVNPTNPHVVSVAALNPDGVYGIGDFVEVAVTFSQAVVLDTSGGIPTLTLETGVIDRVASFSGQPDSRTLVFSYQVTSGDLAADLDYLSAEALALNGATLRNADAQGADLTLPSPGGAGSLAASSDIVVDGVRPIATIQLDRTALKAGQATIVTITFSEAVTGLVVSDFTVDNGKLSGPSSSDGGITWMATLTPDTDVEASANLISLDNTGYTDVAGNTGSGTTESANYVIDTRLPTATIELADTALKAGEITTVTITFSEAVAGLDLSDFTVDNGELSDLRSNDGGLTWTATLSPDADIEASANLITLDNTGFADVAGNTGTGTTASDAFVIDTQPPVVTSVSVPPSGTYVAGQALDFVVHLSEDVVVDIADGEPRLAVTIGTDTVYATWVSSASSATALVFRLTVAEGQMDTDGIALGSSLDLNGATLRDVAGNEVDPALNSSGDTAGILIDAVVPTVSSVEVPGAGYYKAGDTLTFVVNTSEPVTVTGAPQLVLNIGGAAVQAGYVSGSGSQALVFQYTVMEGDNAQGISVDSLVLNGAMLRDAAGNSMELGLQDVADTAAIVIDTQLPTATIELTDTALKVGETATVTITFSEAVAGLDVGDFTVEHGELSDLRSDDGITWTATLTPDADVEASANLISLDNTGYNDVAGNTGTGSTDSATYSIDTRRPVVVSLSLSDTALRVGDTATVTIVFTEAVTDLDLDDFTVANGKLSDLNSTDGITWTAILTPDENVEAGTNLVSLNNTRYTDVAGNTGSGTTESANYAIDTQRPTATIELADTALKAGEITTVTITFSEAVAGLDLSDFTVDNGELSDLRSDDGITWTATLTPDADIEASANLITLDNTGYADVAGNTGTGTTESGGYSIDTQRPTATIELADTALKAGEVTTVTITFSEAVAGLDLSDFTVDNGELSDLSSDDGGLTWTATLTPNADIENSANQITLNNTGYTDIAGNAGAGTTTSSIYGIDTLRPGATIVVDDTALIAGQSTSVTITFSEAVTGLDLEDFTVDNGELSDLRSDDGGLTWTATLTPTADVEAGSNRVSLDGNGYTDIAGNAGTGIAESNAYAIDTLRPTATIVVNDAALRVGESTTVTITFSEAVTGLDLSDFTVDNGELSGLGSSDGGITWTATLTPDADIEASANLITLDNTGVQDSAGNAGTGATESNAYTIDTLLPSASIHIDDTALSAGEAATVTITFSEPVTGLSVADFSVPHGTLVDLATSDGGLTWTATLIPEAGVEAGDNRLVLANDGFSDAAGNAGLGTTESAEYMIDTLVPTIDSVEVPADGAYVAGDLLTFRVHASEVVWVEGVPRLALDIGGTQVFADYVEGSGTGTLVFQYRIEAGLNDADGIEVRAVDLSAAAVRDGFGNDMAPDLKNVDDTSGVTVDTTAPTVDSMVMLDPALTNAREVRYLVTFSEDVAGVDLADFQLVTSGNVVGQLSGLRQIDGRTFEITVSGLAGTGSLALVVPDSGVTIRDLAGNALVSGLTGPAYRLMDNAGDPEYRSSAPGGTTGSTEPLRPQLPEAPPPFFASPLLPPPLFEVPTLGSGLPTVGSVFQRTPVVPSVLAQIFAGQGASPDGSGRGFLGFGGGDGGVFGSSGLAELFEREDDERRSGLGGDNPTTGTDAVQTGAPTLAEQLRQLKLIEQRQTLALAQALQQMAVGQTPG